MGVYATCGVERFTYHYYPDSGGSVIGENELTWGADGWPSAGPEATKPIEPCADGDGSATSGGSGNLGGSANGGASNGGASNGGVAGSGGEVPTTGGADQPSGGTQAGTASAGSPSGGGGSASASGGNVNPGGASNASAGSAGASTVTSPAGDSSNDGGCAFVGPPGTSDGCGAAWLLALALVARRRKQS